jgi:hypothetical protein
MARGGAPSLENARICQDTFVTASTAIQLCNSLQFINTCMSADDTAEPRQLGTSCDVSKRMPCSHVRGGDIHSHLHSNPS